ncbi:class I SAM-dependent methyltransferase [Salmonella enterica subsp. enterica]|nr:class I SAM-dependent methyltransferase [Salmonella enterica subsp. enterica serovar Rubislaw]EDK1589489.1 class I SAM-dependent methyltransferase [Salmonella enterica subsp. enterica serovar Rubislaw]
MNNDDTFEKKYQILRQQNLEAWTGEGYARAWKQLNIIFDRLNSENLLPALPAKFLEFGCGNAAMSSQLMAQKGYDVYGVDISPTAIKWANERFSSLNLKGSFHVDNICDISHFTAESFDIIFDGSCLHCINGEDRADCFKEMKRMIKPNGSLIISTMCGLPKQQEDISNYNNENYQLYQKNQPWRTLNPLELIKKEIINSGLSINYIHVNENPWWDHTTIVCAKS